MSLAKLLSLLIGGAVLDGMSRRMMAADLTYEEARRWVDAMHEALMFDAETERAS